MDTIRQKHVKGVMIRSCARWIEHGEKAGSYFCHLKKRNFQSKRMMSLVRDDQTWFTDASMIIEEIKTFTPIYINRKKI